MVPADSRRIPRAPRYSGYCWHEPGFGYETVTLYGASFQRLLLAMLICRVAVLLPQRGRNLGGLGSCVFARHYLRNHCLFSLPAGTKMFQFPAFASPLKVMTCLQHAGLSHSEICGSRIICISPQLFAAYHVLLRL